MATKQITHNGFEYTVNAVTHTNGEDAVYTVADENGAVVYTGVAEDYTPEAWVEIFNASDMIDIEIETGIKFPVTEAE